MYGMLLESVQHFVQIKYGCEVWDKVLRKSGCKYTVFHTHQIYPDNLMPNIAAACVYVINNGCTEEHFMTFFGQCFIRYLSTFGYENPIRCSGRYFVDFLKNVDNLHLQMRFTYPKMKSPSMYVTHYDKEGAVLVYRSCRKGFTQYFIGQVHQIAHDVYHTKIKITILEETSAAIGIKNVLVRLRLEFDNAEYFASKQIITINRVPLSPVSSSLLLKLFPFGFMIGMEMIVQDIGEKLFHITGSDAMIGRQVTDCFRLRRPRGIPFTWANILCLTSVTFELEVIRNMMGRSSIVELQPGEEITKRALGGVFRKEDLTASLGRRVSQGIRSILLKGQMVHLKEIDSIVFLCSPVVNNLTELQGADLYLNDLSLHGLSRELVLAGWQHCSRLELLYERAEQRSLQLEENLATLDWWKNTGDGLLYSMIPKIVANRLQQGCHWLRTCQNFEMVTAMFCEVVEFGSMTTTQGVMDVVNCMNEVFTCFDALTDRFSVYKVETVGEVYLAVSGAPEYCSEHAKNIVDLGIAFIDQVCSLKTPSAITINVRIGIHSGPIAAGVVGSKVPRYCLFGDTINTTARMQATSATGKIHITSVTKNLLSEENYAFECRGPIFLKGKGKMETFWVKKKVDPLIENARIFMNK